MARDTCRADENHVSQPNACEAARGYRRGAMASCTQQYCCAPGLTMVLFMVAVVAACSTSRNPELAALHVIGDSASIDIAAIRSLDSLTRGRVMFDARRYGHGERRAGANVSRIARAAGDNEAIGAATGAAVGVWEQVTVCQPVPPQGCTVHGADSFIILGTPRIMGDSARILAIIASPGGQFGSFFERDFLIELVRTPGSGWQVVRVRLSRIT